MLPVSIARCQNFISDARVLATPDLLWHHHRSLSKRKCRRVQKFQEVLKHPLKSTMLFIPQFRYPSPHIYMIRFLTRVASIIQVYECMVRGIAVMRRRNDSYVNATQILKVAGVDKGRRTKILEKEILPGKHEIVQGGYGKYQGTW